MKAKEYFDREVEGIEAAIVNNDGASLGEIGKKLYIDFLDETQAICKQRHVKFDRGLHAIIQEQNQKWNALAKMIEAEIGVSVFRRDAFKNTLMSQLAEAKKTKEEQE